MGGGGGGGGGGGVGAVGNGAPCKNTFGLKHRSQSLFPILLSVHIYEEDQNKLELNFRFYLD